MKRRWLRILALGCAFVMGISEPAGVYAAELATYTDGDNVSDLTDEITDAPDSEYLYSDASDLVNMTDIESTQLSAPEALSADAEAASDETDTASDEADVTSIDTASGSNETDAESEEAQAASDPAEAAGTDTVEDDAPFTIIPGQVMYGEDGSNASGNLDSIFKPELHLDGVSYQLTDVDYRFFTDVTLAESINAGNFDEYESVALEEINAGTEVLVCARTVTEEFGALVASQIITISKRKIVITIPEDRNIGIAEKDIPEDESLVISDSDETYRNVSVSLWTGDEAGDSDIAETESESAPASDIVEPVYADDTAATDDPTETDEDSMTADADETDNAATTDGENVISADDPATESESVFVRNDELSVDISEILDGDVVLDLSGIDGDTIGFQEVPATLALSPEYDVNYEIFIQPVGYVYVEESVYHITFNAKNNGVNRSFTYVLNIPSGTTQTVRNAIGAAAYGTVYPGMGGLVSKPDVIAGWDVSADANRYWPWLMDPDVQSDMGDYQLQSKRDYIFTAHVYKRVSDNIYITSMSNVNYDGRAHVAEGTSLKTSDYKSKVDDLAIGVFCDEGGEKKLLRLGKDYSVSYHNNKNASVIIKDDGTYEALYPDNDSRRPRIDITGKGNYAGFKATAYFDILPYNIGTGNPTAAISGLKHLYALNSSGRITAKITPKVTIKFYNRSKITLKKNTDYEPRIYKYNGTNRWILQTVTDPAKITTEGRYLYTVRGRGNYCGTAFGQSWSGVFDDGSKVSMNPAVCSYKGTDYAAAQFLVTNDASKDLANATVTLKKKSVKFVHGKWYSGADLGLKVVIGKGSDARQLTEGVDYKVTYDGADFTYISGKFTHAGSTVYSMSTSDAVFDNAINIANKYKITITAVEGGDFFGVKKTGKTVTIKGVSIRKSDYKGAAKSYQYNGSYLSSGNFIMSRVWGKTTTVVDSSRAGFNSDGSSKYLEKQATYTPDNSVIILFDHNNKLPGTYSCQIYPFGPGVNRSSKLKVSFKRTGIKTSAAVKKGLLRVSMDAADYNVAGSLPKNVVVTYNGHANALGDMPCNNWKVLIEDYEGDWINVTLRAGQNKKAGAGANLIIQGDGKVFKGKSGKFSYSVSYRNIADNTVIPVLHTDSYARIYGRITDTVTGDTPGMLYAQIRPVKKTSGKPEAQITLYQGYFKNATDLIDNRLSLAKLSSSQFKVTLTSIGGSDNNYSVTITNKKVPLIDGFSFGSNVKLAENYTVYDSKVTITGATVVYKGVTYNFPEDINTPLNYTGSQIRFDLNTGDGVKEVRLSNGTVLTPADFYVEYGSNVAVGTGKKGGSFKITLKRNASTGSYAGGGSATFYFTIARVPTAIL